MATAKMRREKPCLFILLDSQSQIEEINAALDLRATTGWRQESRIFVGEASDVSVAFRSGTLYFNDTPITYADQLLLTKKARKLSYALRNPDLAIAVRVADLRAIRDTKRNGYLEEVLRGCGLSKEQRICDTVARYIHHPLTGMQWLEDWHKQWESLGEGKLADLLLNALDLRETRSVCEILWPELTEPPSTTVCTMTGLGTSAGIIARAARQFIPSKMGKSLADIANSRGAFPSSLIVLDDGLWSGFDAIKQIRTALSLRRDEIRNVNIELRFAVRTDLGYA